jgi:hypothetical protein
MNPEKIVKAAQEAQRFLDRVNPAIEAFELRKFGESRSYFVINDTRATAALKRASMDLTMSLADLRKPS